MFGQIFSLTNSRTIRRRYDFYLHLAGKPVGSFLTSADIKKIEGIDIAI
jgi:hypothetical protein